MTEKLTKNQIDKLGDRLRAGSHTDADLKLLAHYTASFKPSYESVLRTLRDRLGLKPTGRYPKVEKSIIDKLRRGSTKLIRMQDIAGCRVIVGDIVEQDRVVPAICGIFGNLRMVDRRIRPSHGYRAVHVIVEDSGRWVEIQVRTRLQDVWAQCSEQLSDAFDQMVKYGEGPTQIQEVLNWASDVVRRWEETEQKYALLRGVGHEAIIKTQRGLDRGRVDIEERLIEMVKFLKNIRAERVKLSDLMNHGEMSDDLSS